MADFSTATWRKATRSNGSGGECVEIAFAENKVGIRDSKNPTKQPHVFTQADWNTFLNRTKKDKVKLQ
ncbi:MAG: DUF397 domain-containing protein [Pseudonocardiaceae bacterium]